MKTSRLTTSAFKPLLSKVFKEITGIEPPPLKPGASFTIGFTASNPTYLTNFGPTFTFGPDFKPVWMDLGAVEYRHLWSIFSNGTTINDEIKLLKDWPWAISIGVSYPFTFTLDLKTMNGEWPLCPTWVVQKMVYMWSSRSQLKNKPLIGGWCVCVCAAKSTEIKYYQGYVAMLNVKRGVPTTWCLQLKKIP